MVRDSSGEATHLSKWAGLGKKSPLVAGASSRIFMLALAGIPLTSGFIGKFGVFTAAIASGATWLVIIAVFASLIAAFFYARVIVLMFFSDPAPTPRRSSCRPPSPRSPWRPVPPSPSCSASCPQPVLELVNNADVFIR